MAEIETLGTGRKVAVARWCGTRVVYGTGPDGGAGEVRVATGASGGAHAAAAHPGGHVTDLCLAGADRRLAVASSAAGALAAFRLPPAGERGIGAAVVADAAAPGGSHRGAATSVSADPSSAHAVASAGEDGRVLMFSAGEGGSLRPTRSFDLSARTASLYVVRHTGPGVVAAAGSGPRVHVLDSRAPSAASRARDPHSADGITALAVHPAMPHVLCTGAASGGVVSAWDLRNQAAPAASVQIGDAAVLDCMFVPSRPSSVLVACADGTLVMMDWNAGDAADSTRVRFDDAERVAVTALYRSGLPLNSLGYSAGGGVVCASDADTLLFYRGGFEA